MDQAELASRLDALAAALHDVAQRVERIETALCDARELRANLDHERQSRRDLAEQTSWLIEVLGDTRKELRWLRLERERLTGEKKG